MVKKPLNLRHKQQSEKKYNLVMFVSKHVGTYLTVSIICVPGRAKALLPTQVPHNKAKVPPHHLLHIGPNGRSRMHSLSQEQLIQNGRLPSIV